MKKKTEQILRVKRVDLPDNMIVWDVNDLDSLLGMRDKDEMLLETDQDIFLLKQLGLIRYSKPEGKPQIVKIQNLSLNRDRYDCFVELTEQDLFNFAKTMRLIVLEAEDGFYIPSSTFFHAEKEKQE